MKPPAPKLVLAIALASLAAGCVHVRRVRVRPCPEARVQHIEVVDAGLNMVGAILRFADAASR